MNASGPRSQQGLSLVELMIGITIGLLVVAGAASILAANRQSYRVQATMARLQEDVRFAFQMIARDMRMADFWGCTRPTNVTNHLDDPGDGVAPPSAFDFVESGGITGIEGVAGPDSVVLRSAGSGLPVVTPYMPQQSAVLHVKNPNDLRAGDVVLVTDCQHSDIFRITSGSPGTSGTVVHNTGATYSPPNYNQNTCDGGNAHCLFKAYGEGSMLYSVSTVGYEIDTGSDGQPALFRTVNGSRLELLPDVSDLQLLYGEDLDDDGSVNRYVQADEAGLDMSQVVSVRVTATMLTGETGVSSAAAGGRMARTFSTIIALRNRTL